jgi:hypothetical protein
VSTNNFTKDVLVNFKFGKFGNYGSQLVVKLNDGVPNLSLENWAYGETYANITANEGVTADNMEKLGKELIQAAAELRNREETAK